MSLRILTARRGVLLTGTSPLRIRPTSALVLQPTRHLLSTPTQSQTPHPPSPLNPRIYYENQTPYLILTLPNGTETTFFIPPQKPISFLLQQILEEDTSITQAAVYELHATQSTPDHTPRPVRWARSTSAEYVLANALQQGGLLLSLDGQPHHVRVPTFEERVEPLKKELVGVEGELQPLMKRKAELDRLASQTSRRIAWFGLGTLCAQWGLMARLTWWEYSWDVMEPISYFVGAGTGILGYMFYMITSKEYTYESLSAITVTRQQRRLYQTHKFDLPRYVSLKERRVLVLQKIEEVKRIFHGHQVESEVEREDVEEVEGEKVVAGAPADGGVIQPVKAS
ncbi:hypothetical protein HK097_001178 [Rhizophlyctis rosea]|uniref:Calcium uniporter protein, mitochondrial n=1 Tax=Rhizophlyctis rosea TaxID=64517 RepID=A0AAD5X1I5_9FUNG|nr:hypothetical protein HK097_001178 [Rhizophlyctis rosea]